MAVKLENVHHKNISYVVEIDTKVLKLYHKIF